MGFNSGFKGLIKSAVSEVQNFVVKDWISTWSGK